MDYIEETIVSLIDFIDKLDSQTYKEELQYKNGSLIAKKLDGQSGSMLDLRAVKEQLSELIK